MLRGDLIRHCGNEFGLDQTAASVEYLLMVDWANEGVRQVLTKTRCTIRSTTVNLTAGQGDYTLTTAVLAMLDRFLTDSGVPYKLARVSIDEILSYRRSLAVATDVPRFYAQEGDTLMFYPAPAANDVLTVWAILRPTEMDTDARDPAASPYGEVPIYAHQAILAYMRYRACQHRPSAARDPNAYWQAFVNECRQARRTMLSMGGRTLAPARVGYPDSPSRSYRNDTYPRA